jgi:NNP family nitrate/nitrite transporter-like MFS transporter
LLSAFLYFDVSFMVWVLLGGLGNFIAEDLGLSGTEKGLMTSLPILSGAALRLPMGMAADRFGARRVGIAGMAVTLVPLALAWSIADTLPLIFLVGLLLGVAGSSFAVALPLASRWYPPEQQGLALGIAGAGNSGTVLASLLAPRLAEQVGWHVVFALAMLPVVAVLIIFSLWAKDSPSAVKAPRFSEYIGVLRHHDAVWFCTFYGVTFGGFVGLASYLAIYFKDQYGLTKVEAGDLTALCVFAGSFARPIGGMLADRFGGIRILFCLYTTVGVAMLGISTSPALTGAVVLFFVSMALLGAGNGTVFQLVPQRFQREIGVLTGLVGAAGGLGGFLLPFLLGSVEDRFGSYGAGFALFALACFGVAWLLLVAQRGWHGTWAPKGSPARNGRARLVITVGEKA